MSTPFKEKCPCCGHKFSLSELKAMAVGDGWQRYLTIDDNGKRVVVSFDAYSPAFMKLWSATPETCGRSAS
jgi:hypothetical protein